MKIYDSLNNALIGLSGDILKEGVWRGTRGYRCLEFPEPITVKITNPTDRYVTIPERKWNKVLPFAELAWILLGLNDLDSLPGNYVKNLYNFSDDGKTWRAGYGPRIRCMNGFNTDYNISHPAHRHINSGYVGTTDQLLYVIKVLERDINSRQAVIEIADPVKDNFDHAWNLKETKDQPCTRLLNFQVRGGELDLTVYMRSNDLLWGFSAVNVFNFTFMLEIVAGIVGVPVGNYYHVANNLHIYEDKIELIKHLSSLDQLESQDSWLYNLKGLTLNKFDRQLEKLWKYEYELRTGSITLMPKFDYGLFHDWAVVFHNYYNEKKLDFINPYLKRLWQV